MPMCASACCRWIGAGTCGICRCRGGTRCRAHLEAPLCGWRAGVVEQVPPYACRATWCLFAPDWVYRMRSRWFPLPRETYDAMIYGFLGVFKMVFIVFNLVPYLALSIVG
ncbi:MAG: DUF6868 family protein [Alphaproteobacteria bacterium]